MNIQVNGNEATIFVSYKGQIKEVLVDVEDVNRIKEDGRKLTIFNAYKDIHYCRIGNQYLHRFLIDAKKGIDVDHQDHNGLNNKKDNLKEVTHSENLLNRNGPTSGNIHSGIRNVYWSRIKKKWYVKFNGKRYGNYYDIEEARQRAEEVRRAS